MLQSGTPLAYQSGLSSCFQCHGWGWSNKWSQSQELTQSIVAHLGVAHVCREKKCCERL